uniref:Cytosolic fatty-acid binding proteins domain-containing protein n=1 Tax=Falco tinnunculus TaxID=100819 RepID=A0A8C4TYX8_FALTI
MPNFSGNWKMKSSENFEELLKALGECEPRDPPPRLAEGGGRQG